MLIIRRFASIGYAQRNEYASSAASSLSTSRTVRRVEEPYWARKVFDFCLKLLFETSFSAIDVFLRRIQGFGGETCRKGPLGRPRLRWEDNIRMGRKEIGSEEWTGLIWLRIGTEWLALVNVVMNLRVPYSAGNFFAT